MIIDNDFFGKIVFIYDLKSSGWLNLEIFFFLIIINILGVFFELFC